MPNKSVFEMVLPAGFVETENAIRFPSRFCRMYYLLVWPSDVYPDWLRDIYSTADVDVSVYVFPYDKYEIMRKLNAMVTRARAHYDLQLKRGNASDLPELEAVLQDAEALRRSVQRNWEKISKMGLIVAVYAETEEDLERKCKHIEGVIAGKSARLVSCFLNQREAYLANLPFGMLSENTSEIKLKDVTLGGTISCLPFIDSSFTHSEGVFLGRSGSGGPLFLNPFIGPPHLSNPHLAVFGRTGAGKSVTLKLIMSRLSLYGVRMLVLDWEGEYEKAALNLCEGSVIKIDPSRESGINPFEIDVDEEDGRKYINLAEKVGDIRSLVGVIVRNYADRKLSAVELSIVEQAVREIYQEKGITEDPESLHYHAPPKDGVYTIGRSKKPLPTMSDFVRMLEAKGAEQLAVELKPFLRGNSLGIFDCESTLNANSVVTVIDLSRIKDEFTRFYAMFVILNWAWHKFAVSEGLKMVINDEAWMFMKYPESAEFLETLARRGRKRKTSVVVASQYIEEFLKSEQGKAVIASCATKILLGQNSEIVPEIISTFRLPPSVDDLLKKNIPGRGLLIAGDRVTPLEVRVTPMEWPFVQTGV